MKAANAAAVYARLRDQPLWRLMAASNAPAILAILQAQFIGEERSLSGPVLFERIERDLETLRGQGHDLPARHRIM